jgi:hypothetical protein
MLLENLKYDLFVADHKRQLAAEASKVGTFSKEELIEISTAMHWHGVKLMHLGRAIRNYVENPFGKYFCKEQMK